MNVSMSIPLHFQWQKMGKIVDILESCTGSLFELTQINGTLGEICWDLFKFVCLACRCQSLTIVGVCQSVEMGSNE